MTVLAFLAGLLLLIIGAEGLVRGASRLANRFGMSPLIIGLTALTLAVLAVQERHRGIRP